MGIGLVTGACVSRAEPESFVHSGMSNASAAVAVGDRWVLVASDESNRLQLYRADRSGGPVGGIDLLPRDPDGVSDRELDLEGGARIGDYAYWIGSHGRNKDGKKRPLRRRLMAVRVLEEQGQVRLDLIGRPYENLIDDLDVDPAMAPFRLKAASKVAPEEGGLNIEGLSAAADGGLWIGLRSPLASGERCLLVRLLNPAEVLAGLPGRFAAPVTLDLDGRGIRDMAWSGREYFLVAGDAVRGGKSRLYRWGGPGTEPVRVTDTGFKHFNPEAVAVYGSPDRPRLLVLSDDGNRVARKGLDQQFRSFWVEP